MNHFESVRNEWFTVFTGISRYKQLNWLKMFLLKHRYKCNELHINVISLHHVCVLRKTNILSKFGSVPPDTVLWNARSSSLSFSTSSVSENAGKDWSWSTSPLRVCSYRPGGSEEPWNRVPYEVNTFIRKQLKSKVELCQNHRKPGRFQVR